jgi:signal transduction histidine kinase
MEAMTLGVPSEEWGLRRGSPLAGVALAAATVAGVTVLLYPLSQLDPGVSSGVLYLAADEERGRVVRDLHDGAQQSLVHAVVTLKLARQPLRQGSPAAEELLDEALHHAQRANAELRELARGILPSVLTRGGLRAGVSALASRMRVGASVDVSVGRLPSAIEAAAYFVVAEALTNVAKHAGARSVQVSASVQADALNVTVRDDGAGGATPHGNGLQGLEDRLAARDGALRIHSPPGGGTVVAATIPLCAPDGGHARVSAACA